MPKIDRIVGKAVHNISDAADAIGHAASRVGERLSQTRRNLKDHIKLGHAKPKWSRVNDLGNEPPRVDFREEPPRVDFREDLEETIPQQSRGEEVPAQPSAARPNRMELEARSILSAIEYGYKKRYLASLTTFAEYAKEEGSQVAAKAFIKAFERRTEESQASIRDNIREVHSAAVELVKAKGADQAVLGWSELMMKQLGKLAPAVRPKRDRVQNENLDEINEALADLPPRVQPSNDDRLEDLLGSTERLHATVKDLLAAILEMDYDAYEDTQKILFELKDDLGPDLIRKAFAEERERLEQQSPGSLYLVDAHARKLAHRSLAERNENDEPRTADAQGQNKPIPPVAATFEQAAKRLNIPEVLGTLHAIGQVNEIGQSSAILEAIKSAKFDQTSEFSIQRLNTLMEYVGKELPKDEDFDEDGREQLRALYGTWLALKTLNPALNVAGEKYLPRTDRLVAKNTLLDLLRKPTPVSMQKAKEFLSIMNGMRIGRFLETLHDLARATPEEFAAFRKSLATALEAAPPLRSTIDRLNNLMAKLYRDTVDADGQQGAYELWQAWNELKKEINSLNTPLRNRVPNADIEAATKKLTELFRA